MRDEGKTKAQLISELEELRQRSARLEVLEAKRKNSEEEIRSAHARLRATFDAIQENMNIVDLDFYLTDVNEVLIKGFGLSNRESVLGRKCFEVLKGRKDICPNCAVAEVYQSKASVYRTTTPEDEVSTRGRSFEIFAYPVMDEHGNISGAVEFARDITERKQAEKALRESEERHRMSVEASPDPIVIYDMEGRATYINPAFAENFGWSSHELLGERIEFVPEENWPETRVAIARMLRGERIQSFETRRLTKDGRILDIQLSSSVFNDGDGNRVGNIVILRDVTLRKQAEDALRKSEAELSEKSRHLEEVNAALKVLLKQREGDKADLEGRLFANVKELVLPYVEKLKNSRLYSDQMTLVGILESNMKEIVSPFVTKLSSRFLSLTPTEIQVASLIKDGKTSKEIASVLHASENTVRSHRFHIRSKLGIKNKKVNFRSYLQSLQDE
jgi:PAS domain S-box-containing protein